MTPANGAPPANGAGARHGPPADAADGSIGGGSGRGDVELQPILGGGASSSATQVSGGGVGRVVLDPPTGGDDGAARGWFGLLARLIPHPIWRVAVRNLILICTW